MHQATTYITQEHDHRNTGINETRLNHFVKETRKKQHFISGAIAGLIAALIGAGIWAAITVTTEFQIGWMAIGLGCLVGFAVRVFGNGIDKRFGVLGAILALFGCLLGNLMAIVFVVSKVESIPIMNIVMQLNPAIIAVLLKETFCPIDALFYGIALYEGYRFSFKRFTESELTSRLRV